MVRLGLSPVAALQQRRSAARCLGWMGGGLAAPGRHAGLLAVEGHELGDLDALTGRRSQGGEEGATVHGA
jgi:hypothetical protein